MSEKSPQQQLEDVIKLYLEKQKTASSQASENLELEVRFGTKGQHKITHNNYENVIKKLISLGFVSSNPEYILRISNEFVDPKTGVTKISNIRGEISGLGPISKYCQNDSIIDSQGNIIAKFDQKYHFRNGDKTIYPVDFEDFNFRVALQSEKRLSHRDGRIRNTKESWNDTKKIFRLINRSTLRNDKYPIKVDVSIVKSSLRKGRFPIPEYKFKESGVLNSPQQYEIEIEVDNDKIRQGSLCNTPESLNNVLKKVIKFILSGLQSTNYPISYPEQQEIKDRYMQIIWGKKDNNRITNRNFIGPSSYTLQVRNIAPVNENMNIPNIRNNYTVTDKADGDRKLLLISNKGKIYLIDTNMNVQFTGSKTQEADYFDTIIDGEHILLDKTGKWINKYAAFDIYYIKGKDVRAYAFMHMPEDKTDPVNFRLPLLNTVINKLKPTSVIKSDTSPLNIVRKQFLISDKTNTIFQACLKILERIDGGQYFEYETDGLIFTPMSLPVGGSLPGQPSRPMKTTWEHSFKWKPVEFNTIDFLVTLKKNTNGSEFIGNIFQNGTNTSITTQLTQYKTAILRVGFNEKKDGYINPCLDIIEDKLPDTDVSDTFNDYKPMQFFPTNPPLQDAGICNLLLKDGVSGDKIIVAESGEIIEDNVIVEFRYDKNREEGWRWVPLRVRFDKTAELRNGGKNFGNAYHVANSNWHSIHNPITKDMIATGNNIPDEIADDDIYYNRVTDKSDTEPMRNFHNLFVKKLLINSVAKRGDTLIDLAVGKGGDLSKWIDARLKFVLGIDNSRDNIENRLNGACARFLNYRKKTKMMPRALFIYGNSFLNIRNTDAIYTDKGKKIIRAVFGQGAKDSKELGEGVYKSYGIGTEGFNICSIQFAIHYMFGLQQNLQDFLRNVSETTKVGGYFIGTSYDGASIFKMLENKKVGESETIMENGNKIWGITKQYDHAEFPNDSSCLGYAIDVYQDSINKTFREYLVNYAYLTRLLEDYGFVLLKQDETKELGLPGSTGLFRELFGAMMQTKKQNKYGKARDMTPGQKRISFLNRYFVYKKVRAVDADKVSLSILGQTLDEEKTLEQESAVAQQAAKEVVASKGKKAKKIPKKLILKASK
tara:strand:+ start:4089 stop:7418 length:3330 start_codon:yes stop_codon:yes gene_type:complete